MKTYTNLYEKLCSLENLEKAFQKAKERKSHKSCVIKFEENLNQELNNLKKELETFTYKPKPLKKFIIRDPKTRVIHASAFRDRVIHHALILIIAPIFEPTFIYDSYANQINKGTHKAVLRFDKFKRKVSQSGRLVSNNYNNKNLVRGFVFKADIKHYFDTVDHKILISIIKRNIKDKKVIWLIRQILNNFNTEIKGKGMPLGNLTSQFFANVYLNDLDYYIKHELKAKYYIRYVDDFVILHKDKKTLEEYKIKINGYIKNLKLELHPTKSKILPLRNGLTMLGYRIFYHHKLLRKSNIRKFEKRLASKLKPYKQELIIYEELLESLRGWFGYALWANTYAYRKNIMKRINSI